MKDWRIFRTGRRNSDGWFAINLVAGRICFLGFSDRKDERVLEPLTMDYRLKRVGVHIWSHTWRDAYVLKYRGEWIPDDYFIHADRIMGDRGMVTP